MPIHAVGAVAVQVGEYGIEGRLGDLRASVPQFGQQRRPGTRFQTQPRIGIGGVAVPGTQARLGNAPAIEGKFFLFPVDGIHHPVEQGVGGA